MKEINKTFDLDKVIHELKHYLPAQAPLKDFIHHNTLHAFQEINFHEALVKANKIFGYKTYLRFDEYRNLFEKNEISKELLLRVIKNKKGDENISFWYSQLFDKQELSYSLPRIGAVRDQIKSIYSFDLDANVHPFLFRFVASYLDQGISIWNFPSNSNDFFKSIRDLERNSFVGIFKSERVKKLVLSSKTRIEDLLKILVGKEDLFEHYLFDQQFSHPGWSGIVSVIEDQPGTLLDQKSISLIDLIKFELLLEIDTLDNKFGDIWAPLGEKIKNLPVDLFAEVKTSKIDELKEIWQEAYENTYYDKVLNGLQNAKSENIINASTSFQAVFCIDDRECSIRRYVEQEVPSCKTYGTAGHFNVEFYFQPENGKFHTKVCPAPITPKYLIQEYSTNKKKKKDFHFNKQSHSLIIGWILTHTIGLWSGIRLALSIFKPRMNASTSASTLHMDPNSSLTIQHENKFSNNGLQIGFTIQEMADRVEILLKSIGLITDFAPIIYTIGHGSTSVNNTHYAGYDCGACSGRPGSVNARVIASMANNPEVREKLTQKGISLPNSTQFVGALHDTSRDEIFFFDETNLNEKNIELHKENMKSFTKALDHNAKERSRRFVSVNSNSKLSKIHKDIKTRTVSLFEPRPELNHATNTLAIVGRRSFTKNVFLDRRAFLNSFDYQIDPEGEYLLNILNAVAPVCGGINLEYYFSRVDNYNLGAGTKLPHNVMGLIGVANGTDGDLRTGLPKQMIEIHDPLRLMVVVEHYPEVVLKTIKKNPATYNWFEKEWVKLVACNPETNMFYAFKNGAFEPYEILEKNLESVSNLEALIEYNMVNLPILKIQA